MQPYNGNGQAVIVIHIAIGQYTSMCITYVCSTCSMCSICSMYISMFTIPKLYWTEYTLISQ